MYERIILNCFRYLGMTRIADVDRMTVKEYRLNMKAQQLRELDEMLLIHHQAWANQRVKATKGKQHKPVYKTFDSFFNFKEQEDELLNRVYKPSSIGERIAAYERDKNGG